jgi:hypothetical protein
MFRHFYFVTISQQAFLDAFAVDLGAVGTVQVFQKGVVTDRNDYGMTAADCIVSQMQIVVGFAPDHDALTIKLLLPNQFPIEINQQF